MKKINQINQFLLVKYPNIWNTRITWMLLIGLAVHLIFFFIGFVSHLSPSSLHTTDAKDDYFSSGLIFVHLIISVLMVVGWLIFMLKNNAFKNFYPTSGRKLFAEFFQYFVIILVSISFYFSYMAGFRLFINSKYGDEIMMKNEAIINDAAAFLSQDLEVYTLENRLSPQPFLDFYCETSVNKINKNQKYFVYYNRAYQYYSTYPIVVTKKDKNGDFLYPLTEKNNQKSIAYHTDSNDGKTRTIFFKNKVEDLSAYIKTAKPSYYNYSTIFYENNTEAVSFFGRRYNTLKNNDDVKKAIESKKVQLNQNIIAILNSGDNKRLEKLLQDFLTISKDFEIGNNLNAKSWTNLVYQPTNFELTKFIQKYKPKPGEIYDANKSNDGHYAEATVDAAAENAYVDDDGKIADDSISIKNLDPNWNKNLSPAQFFKANVTDYYYYTADLKNLLDNVDSIKSYDFYSETIHIYLWIAFAFAAFIFSFRVTNLRSLLFAIISSGVITLAVTLFCVFCAFVLSITSSLFSMYTVFVVGCIILILPFLLIRRYKKLISSVFMILSMSFFPLFVWLIFVIINENQTADCRRNYIDGVQNYNCHGILDWWGAYTVSFVILLCSFVFMYFYTAFIKKWKSIPE